MKRLADDANPIRIAIALNGQIAGDADGFNARQSREAARDLAEQRYFLLGPGIGLARRGHLESREMSRIHAEFDVKEPIEAFAEQPGADQENNGDGEFSDNEIRTDALPEASRGGAPAIAKPFSQVKRRKAQNWSQGHESGGEQSDDTCEQSAVHTETDVREKGNIGSHRRWDQSCENGHRPFRDEDTG